MQFKVDKKTRKTEINEEDMKIAVTFAKKIYKELSNLVQALILFGSTARKRLVKGNDLDILIIIDDVHIKLTREVIETYRIIVAKIIGEVEPRRLHVQSMKLSTFWEYIRAGDPVAINILRDGIALIDTGFFDPLQALLDEGRIRPSKEAIWNYFTMSYASLVRARQHLLTGIVDFYWAAIDASHAALMSIGETPPTPSHAADVLREKMVNPGLIEEKYARILQELYLASKKIINREVRSYSGRDYERFRKMTEEFVGRIKKWIEKRK